MAVCLGSSPRVAKDPEVVLNNFALLWNILALFSAEADMVDEHQCRFCG